MHQVQEVHRSACAHVVAGGGCDQHEERHVRLGQRDIRVRASHQRQFCGAKCAQFIPQFLSIRARSPRRVTESRTAWRRRELYSTYAPRVNHPTARSSALLSEIPSFRSTTSFSAEMNVGESPTAGIMRKRSMPNFFASTRPSMLISCKVSMCSVTKEIGTTSASFTPSRPRRSMVSRNGGSSHFIGPTRLW